MKVKPLHIFLGLFSVLLVLALTKGFGMFSRGVEGMSAGMGPLNIRYVRVAYPSGVSKCIQIAQIAVYSGGMNVAIGKTTTASDPYSVDSSSGKAIDGTLAPRNYPDIYHSKCDPGNFWELDLSQEYPIEKLVYYNRMDCCNVQADGMLVSLMDNNRTILQNIKLSDALTQSFPVEGPLKYVPVVSTPGSTSTSESATSGDLAGFGSLTLADTLTAIKTGIKQGLGATPSVSSDQMQGTGKWPGQVTYGEAPRFNAGQPPRQWQPPSPLQPDRDVQTDGQCSGRALDKYDTTDRDAYRYDRHAYDTGRDSVYSAGATAGSDASARSGSGSGYRYGTGSSYIGPAGNTVIVGPTPDALPIADAGSGANAIPNTASDCSRRNDRDRYDDEDDDDQRPSGTSCYQPDRTANRKPFGRRWHRHYQRPYNTECPAISQGQKDMPTGRQDMPTGRQDMYILKSQIVPPVCPACPSSCALKPGSYPPCPPCARCPESAFTCKKVPAYGAESSDMQGSEMQKDGKGGSGGMQGGPGGMQGGPGGMQGGPGGMQGGPGGMQGGPGGMQGGPGGMQGSSMSSSELLSDSGNTSLPKPVLADFSSFGM